MKSLLLRVWFHGLTWSALSSLITDLALVYTRTLGQISDMKQEPSFRLAISDNRLRRTSGKEETAGGFDDPLLLRSTRRCSGKGRTRGAVTSQSRQRRI